MLAKRACAAATVASSSCETSSAAGVGIYAAGAQLSLDTAGAWQSRGVAAPALAPAGQGRIYFDNASNKFRVSENGLAYVDLLGSGGLTGSGSPSQVAFFTSDWRRRRAEEEFPMIRFLPVREQHGLAAA